MCGIAGIFHYRDPSRPIDRELLLHMTRALAHRGPDDEGIYVSEGIGLGHRRLSIVDLSATGHQPMTEDGRSWLSFNGELYNHHAFRSELASRFGPFRGTSDTEVLLRLVKLRGASCLPELAGIFAFAYWDEDERELLLVRDPLGVKQLYYVDDGQRLLFASEIKALLVAGAGVPRDVDEQAISEYLTFHTPLFERTFFKRVRQLRQGSALRIKVDTPPRETCYWSVEDPQPAPERVRSPAAAVEELRSLLKQIVDEQLMSDVPVGAFFSGGIDSSAVAAYALRTGRLRYGFGVHFSDQGVIDERPYQEAAAKALGLDLELITMDGSSFADDLRRLIYYQDAPVIGPAMFPMYYVSQLAASKVTVCLGGQGADEIFAGYARYALTQPMALAGAFLKRLTGRLWRRGKSVGAEPGAARVQGSLFKQLFDLTNLRRLAHSVPQFRDFRRLYFHHFAKVPERLWGSIFSPAASSREPLWTCFRELVDSSIQGDRTTKLLAWDAQTYLPGLFHQDDRMSMAHSLESRVPIADPRVVRFAFGLPVQLKIHAGTSKWILREAVKDVLPEFVLNRRKVGFDTPVPRWIVKQEDFVRDVLFGTRTRERGLFDVKGLEAIYRDQRHPYWSDVVWKCLCIEVWARTMVDEDGLRSSEVGAAQRVRAPRD